MRVDHRLYLLVRLPEIYPSSHTIPAHNNVKTDIAIRTIPPISLSLWTGKSVEEVAPKCLLSQQDC